MPIYVAREYNDTVLGVVLARDKLLAFVYWQGQDIHPHHVDELTEDNLSYHPTGVIPIVRTKEAVLYKNGDYIYEQRVIHNE